MYMTFILPTELEKYWIIVWKERSTYYITYIYLYYIKQLASNKSLSLYFSCSKRTPFEYWVLVLAIKKLGDLIVLQNDGISLF